MSVHIHRRSVLALAAAAVAPAAWSQAAAGGTLAQIKQRGALRVGVTQAPPWFSKDPKSGEWASGVGVSLGKAMAADLGVKFEPVEVTWGTAIAALQGNKIDMMSMMDATPERAEAVDFPKTPLLWYSLAVLARDDLPVKAWADLDKPSVRIAVPQASSMDKFLSEHVAKASISRFPGNAEAIAAFQADLDARGLADRVLVHVWSEFGRRAQQNGSGGTDHGAAGVSMVIGSRVAGRMVGEWPDLGHLDVNGNQRENTDFRSLYCSLLEQWLGTDAARVIPGADRLARYPLLR